MFLDTLVISTTIKPAFHKTEEGNGLALPDGRGKHDNHKRIEKVRESWVIGHIRSFKVGKSYYLRKTDTTVSSEKS